MFNHVDHGFLLQEITAVTSDRVDSIRHLQAQSYLPLPRF